MIGKFGEDLAVRRIRKRVQKHVDRLRKVHGDGLQAKHFKRVPLISLPERLWLLVLAGLLLYLLYILSGVWWSYVVILPVSGFFLWRVFAGSDLDLSGEFGDLSAVELQEADIPDDLLNRKVDGVLATRGGSYLVFEALIAIAVLIVEIAVVLLGVVGGVLGG